MSKTNIQSIKIMTANDSRTVTALEPGVYQGIYCGYELRVSNWEAPGQTLVVEFDVGIRGAFTAMLTIASDGSADLVEGEPAQLPGL